MLTFILGFYLFCFAWFFFSSFVHAIFKVKLIQHLYLLGLEKLFSYAASTVAEDDVQLRKDYGSVDNFETYVEDLIDRDVELTEAGVIWKRKLLQNDDKTFKFDRPLYLIKCGVEAIIEDPVTKRFSSAELRVWNFLSRNSCYIYAKKDHHTTLFFLWILGLIVRYLIFFPCRFSLFLFSIILMWIIGMISKFTHNERIRNWLLTEGTQICIRLCLCSFSAVIKFHDIHNRPKRNTICVANHTTPFDWCVLASDLTYAIVGQKHSGFFGLMENLLSLGIETIWFDREEGLDRVLTADKLKNYAAIPNSFPILIFPEGTCINNTSVMKFKKGSFEVGVAIHPVAIKYNPLFADCFWNSSRDSFFQYSLKMMTSWAMVVDVWYLPSTEKSLAEDSIGFARRVQHSIAQSGGMIGMDWDGELKRRRPNEKLRTVQQKFVSQYVIPSEVYAEKNEKEQ